MKNFIIALCVLLLTSGCKKNKPETINISGKIFGCKLNGEIFIPDHSAYINNISPIHIAISHRPIPCPLNSEAILISNEEKKDQYTGIAINRPLTKRSP